jgi:hypothetical protein
VVGLTGAVTVIVVIIRLYNHICQKKDRGFWNLPFFRDFARARQLGASRDVRPKLPGPRRTGEAALEAKRHDLRVEADSLVKPPLAVRQRNVANSAGSIGSPLSQRVPKSSSIRTSKDRVPDDLLFGCAEPFRPAQVSFNAVNQIGRLPVCVGAAFPACSRVYRRAFFGLPSRVVFGHADRPR